MLHRSTSRVSAAVALTATVFVWRPALSAQGRGGAAAGPPLVPVTASSLAKHPETYIGATVALTATVERQLSPTVFVVDQDKAKSLPEVVLVIAPTLQSPPPANSYVNVVGDAIAFDPVEVAKRLKDYKLDVAPDVCLIAEPTDLALSRSLRGFGVAHVRFTGRASHSSQAHLGVNAVMHMGRLLHAVDVRAPSLRERDGDLMVTVARGGSSPFVVPDAAECFVELRTSPDGAGASVVDEVVALAEQHDIRTGRTIDQPSRRCGHRTARVQPVPRPISGVKVKTRR